MNKENYCFHCEDEICEFNENEHFGINWKIYCSLDCFYEDDKKEQPSKDHKEMMDVVNEAKQFLNKNKTKRQDSKATNRSQANKGNKRQKQVLKKKSKSKTR